MYYCSNCRSQLDREARQPFDRLFCAICGAHAGIRRGAPIADNGAESSSAPTGKSLPDHVAGPLCYCAGLITGILFLAVKPYSRRPAIRFHAYQSILFHFAVIALAFVDVSLDILFPEESLTLDAMWLPIWATVFFLWLFLIWEAYEGKRIVLPLIGAFAEAESKNVDTDGAQSKQ